MRHDNWPFKYGPPPEDLPSNDNSWPGAWLFFAFVLIAPLIYFGPQLGAVEAWFVDLYRVVDQWIAPIRDFLFG